MSEKERVYDKINYQTNFTSTSTFAILLRAIQSKGTVNSEDARKTLFPNARADAGMNWNRDNRDTHGEISLAQYGLIEYVSEGTFKLSALGSRFLELFNDDFSVKDNCDYSYVSTMIDAIFSWSDKKYGRNINVGVLLFELLLNDKLDEYITAEEWSYVAEFSGIRSNEQFNEIVDNICDNRVNGTTYELKKANVFLDGLAGTWRVLVKSAGQYRLRDIAKDIIVRKLEQIDSLKGFEKPVLNIDKYSTEWFKEKAKEFADIDIEAEELYKAFKEKFAPEVIKDLKDEELLNSLFLGGNSDNMCHELEYVTRNKELFGSVKSGTAFKYPLFKRGEKWMSGTSHNPIELSLPEAIIKGTQVRDALVNGAQIISDSLPLNTVEDYLSLYTKLYAVMPEIVDSLWVIKYFHMIFNEAFPVFYNKDWQLKVLSVLKKEANDTAYGRLAQINIFVNECEITNVVFAQIFHKYCRNVEVEEEDDEIEEPAITRLTGGENIILYGVPGAGKSWTIKKQYCSDDACIERLVFHPDYTYSDFVGQILPKISEDGSVSYVFTAGPFTNLVKKAYQNPDKMYYLVIEEVNRGNAPAIFGDVFQLLDRKEDGSSEYEITNADIAKIVYGSENHKVSIPSNMSILCTMNTSDQNVFTLDTAFQRRWSMRLIKNVFHEEEEDEKKFANSVILDTDVTWNKFFTEINKIILNKNIRMTSSEDKRLGTHFVGPEDLKFVEGDEKQNSRFPEKVLKYLWDDAFKFTKEDIFDLEKVKSLEDVIEIFVGSKGNERFRVFKENIFNTIVTNPTNAKENA